MATDTITERLPIAKARDDLDAVIQHVHESKQPVVLAGDGGVAVVIIDAEQYRKQRETTAYLRAILEGLLSEGGVSHEEVVAQIDALPAE